MWSKSWITSVSKTEKESKNTDRVLVTHPHPSRKIVRDDSEKISSSLMHPVYRTSLSLRCFIYGQNGPLIHSKDLELVRQNRNTIKMVSLTKRTLLWRVSSSRNDPSIRRCTLESINRGLIQNRHPRSHTEAIARRWSTSFSYHFL